MAPIGPSHAACVRNMIELFSTQKGKAALLDVQNPVLVGDIFNSGETLIPSQLPHIPVSNILSP
ncbi:hypothetical protein THIOM_003399 [Candidatus Thiomargarita nelsonii]|uniref:Uncharacterized protein n=1 Tax=Candidatus Thiomargarita nelsonii TaxID=1003181 RepID=A0A176RYK8_9GAMM|nr:hypothetical protein THIOM_003399 [Candidatus Thiomargarita nelsonii]